MREHKSRWSHSWSLLLMGMYIVQHTLAFLQHWRIVFFKAVNKFFQILHGKQKKRKRNVWLHLLNYEIFFASMIKQFPKRFDGKYLKIGIQRVHFQIRKSSKIFLYKIILKNYTNVCTSISYQHLLSKF